VTIHKFPLVLTPEVLIRMPRGARLLSVHTQRNAPELWALVDTDAPLVTRRIAVRGTGLPCDGLAFAPFVGTFLCDADTFVGHVFDLGEEP
jgi:hypothetical protein